MAFPIALLAGQLAKLTPGRGQPFGVFFFQKKIDFPNQPRALLEARRMQSGPFISWARHAGPESLCDSEPSKKKHGVRVKLEKV